MREIAELDTFGVVISAFKYLCDVVFDAFGRLTATGCGLGNANW